MYNIEVDGDHCYRVGQQGLLVHNASALPDPVPNVQMTNASGSPIGEFDEISLAAATLTEDKRASLAWFQIQATRQNITVEMIAEQWAELQIYTKTVGRIAALQSAVGTRPEEGGTRQVPCIDDFRGFRTLIFRVSETDARVRAAVNAQVQRLRAAYPNWTSQFTP